MFAARPAGRTRPPARPSRSPGEGAVAGLPVRHSPGRTRREAARDATETRLQTRCGVREVSCFLPLQRQLHVLCQCGARRKICSLRMLPLAFAASTDSDKARAICALLTFDF